MPDNSAAYPDGTFASLLVMAFAPATRPSVGVSPLAARTHPAILKGWEYSPSDWFQRLPVILLAVMSLLVSRYLTAFQLEMIPGVWEPFFGPSPGAAPGQNGAAFITSKGSEAWPVPDAGVDTVTCALEIVVGLVSSSRRWRTMPWLVVLFGVMIVPLGAGSILFIVIQPDLVRHRLHALPLRGGSDTLADPVPARRAGGDVPVPAPTAPGGTAWPKVFVTDEGEDALARDDFARDRA